MRYRSRLFASVQKLVNSLISLTPSLKPEEIYQELQDWTYTREACGVEKFGGKDLDIKINCPACIL